MRNFLLRSTAKLIRTFYSFRIPKLSKDNRPTADFKLVFFCGQYGIKYLNASLYSVHANWDYLPEVYIVTDGTPKEIITNKMVKWPKIVSIISWTECAEYFRNKGNENLHSYASKELWGKKMISIMYLAEKFPCLYSDTDVLWFSSPQNLPLTTNPVLKMSEDIEFCYSYEMLKTLNEEDCLNKKPLNAGVIYASGDYASYNKWHKLCDYLNSSPDNRSEQTAFAILNNYFNPEQFFSKQEIIITSNDQYTLKYTKKDFPHIIARHFAGIKSVTFWRDLLYMKWS